MNRRWCLLVAAGSALLAVVCWRGDSGALVWQVVRIAHWISDPCPTVAYAAPPARASDIRLASPKDDEFDDRAAVVASDQNPFESGSHPVCQTSGVAPQGQRASALNELESTLPDDEPEELVARRPTPRRDRSPPKAPFVERPPASPRARRTQNRPLQRQSSTATAGPHSGPANGQPTLADPQDEPGSSTPSDAAIEPLPENPSESSAELAPRELPQSAPPSPENDAARSEEETEPVLAPNSDGAGGEPTLVQPQAEPGLSADGSAASDTGPLNNPAERSARALSAVTEQGVLLRWHAPEEIQVEAEAECQLLVENVTGSTLTDVIVQAQLPAGLRLVRAVPACAQGDGTLGWDPATLDPHQQRTIHLWVVATGEGEIEPSATVTFSHAASARLNVIHPQLSLECDGPDNVLAGQPAGVRVRVGNPGTGKARDVVVQLRLDRRLHHPAGSELRYEVGTLASGESREVQVALSPTEAGRFTIQAEATAEPGLVQETSYELEVIKPTLQVAVEGPRLRYVDRQATYSITVHNPGPAPADNVQVFDEVPSGFRFVEASSGGTFDAQARQVAWFVGRLEPNQSTEVNLQLIATEPGEQRISASVKADAGVVETAETITRVEGVASVAIDVVDADDPIEVSGETSYEIRLTNRGSQTAQGVQAAAKLPAELEPLEATGPTTGRIQGQQVVFEPLDELAPGQTQIYRVRVKCQRAGQVTFRAYFRDADHPTAVAEEELTRVYQD